jgi:hypothetical protein
MANRDLDRNVPLGIGFKEAQSREKETGAAAWLVHRLNGGLV